MIISLIIFFFIIVFIEFDFYVGIKNVLNRKDISHRELFWNINSLISKEILEEFNQIESNKPDPVIKSFFEKAKKFWKKT